MARQETRGSGSVDFQVASSSGQNYHKRFSRDAEAMMSMSNAADKASGAVGALAQQKTDTVLQQEDEAAKRSYQLDRLNAENRLRAATVDFENQITTDPTLVSGDEKDLERLQVKYQEVYDKHSDGITYDDSINHFGQMMGETLGRVKNQATEGRAAEMRVQMGFDTAFNLVKDYTETGELAGKIPEIFKSVTEIFGVTDKEAVNLLIGVQGQLILDGSRDTTLAQALLTDDEAKGPAQKMSLELRRTLEQQVRSSELMTEYDRQKLSSDMHNELGNFAKQGMLEDTLGQFDPDNKYEGVLTEPVFRSYLDLQKAEGATAALQNKMVTDYFNGNFISSAGTDGDNNLEAVQEGFWSQVGSQSPDYLALVDAEADPTQLRQYEDSFRLAFALKNNSTDTRMETFFKESNPFGSLEALTPDDLNPATLLAFERYTVLKANGADISHIPEKDLPYYQAMDNLTGDQGHTFMQAYNRIARLKQQGVDPLSFRPSQEDRATLLDDVQGMPAQFIKALSDHYSVLIATGTPGPKALKQAQEYGKERFLTVDGWGNAEHMYVDTKYLKGITVPNIEKHVLARLELAKSAIEAAHDIDASGFILQQTEDTWVMLDENNRPFFDADANMLQWNTQDLLGVGEGVMWQHSAAEARPEIVEDIVSNKLKEVEAGKFKNQRALFAGVDDEITAFMATLQTDQPLTNEQVQRNRLLQLDMQATAYKNLKGALDKTKSDAEAQLKEVQALDE